MKYKFIKLGVLLTSIIVIAKASNIAYIPKTGPGDAAGAGKQWPNTRFVINGDCVTDNLTGLVWLKNTKQVCSAGCNWSNAFASIAAFNTAGGDCGYNNWRLPNINELKSLVNYSASTTMGVFWSNWLTSVGFTNIDSNQNYWTATTYGDAAAWYINSTRGETITGNRNDNAWYVWPVRGGQ
ncbi:DUF1566 domain-containing protein [Aquella oligotrophica]|nr:DUF1566 domain-containing protein [Aquella oligotrophica]